MFRFIIDSMTLPPAPDPASLRALLRRDPVGSLYMLADLEPPWFDQCRWLVETEDGASAVGMIFLGLETPAVLVSGDLLAVRRIVERRPAELPDRCYIKLTGPQMEVCTPRYHFSEIEELDIMMLREPGRPQQNVDVELRLLTPADPLDTVLEVYRDYPGNFFEPSQLLLGLYAGAWIQGRLAAIAGTHAYSPGEGVAVLGNIATATRFRGHGLCTALTTFLCDELRTRGCGLIGLHVASGNAPAIACYRRCGFAKDRSVFTMLARRVA
jgi:ribosomal protein S18 acetylase RimI-like enzyme